ncbi:MAG: amidohydrolase family protein, partial [Dermatophilaceae bacterium]
NLQAFWAALEAPMVELTLPFLGDPRRGQPAQSRGAPRGGAGAPRVPPEQRLDLASALTAYTAGSAFVNRHDDTGTIREGALADLVVLDRDPFAGPPVEIGSTRVLQTFIDGRLVFAADDA